MIEYKNVESTVQPSDIWTDAYHVYTATNIREDNSAENTTYIYDMCKYEKDEYITNMNGQITDTQLAIVEIYEELIMNG